MNRAFIVIPVKTGIQVCPIVTRTWMLACAGMTDGGNLTPRLLNRGVLPGDFSRDEILHGYDIWTVPELLRLRDISTTAIFIHVLNRGGMGVHSPADQLGIDSDRL